MDGIQWVDRHSAFQDADHCRFIDEDFIGHSLDTLDKWRLQNTGGRGSHQLKDDDANGILQLLTGNQANDEMILDMANKRQVDPSLSPCILFRAKALSSADIEVRLGLVDVLAQDHCLFVYDNSVSGDIFANAYSGGGQTENFDTGIAILTDYRYYGIYINSAGRPFWEINGVPVAEGDDADVDPTEFFQPYVQVEAEAGADVKTLEIDFIKGWQRRE